MDNNNNIEKGCVMTILATFVVICAVILIVVILK